MLDGTYQMTVLDMTSAALPRLVQGTWEVPLNCKAPRSASAA